VSLPTMGCYPTAEQFWAVGLPLSQSLAFNGSVPASQTLLFLIRDHWSSGWAVIFFDY